jgi:hypothetical protein
MLIHIDILFINFSRYDKKLSTESHLHDLEEIVNPVNNTTFIANYNSYCVYFTHYFNKLIFIEINTPVWLVACSKLFCLDVPYNVEILMREYIPDIINYSVIRKTG